MRSGGGGYYCGKNVCVLRPGSAFPWKTLLSDASDMSDKAENALMSQKQSARPAARGPAGENPGSVALRFSFAAEKLGGIAAEILQLAVETREGIFHAGEGVFNIVHEKRKLRMDTPRLFLCFGNQLP